MNCYVSFNQAEVVVVFIFPATNQHKHIGITLEEGKCYGTATVEAKIGYRASRSGK